MIILDDTKLKIIDSFILLGEINDNLDEITMDLIADKAGIKRQNIYKNHFSGIKEIIDAMHNMIDSESYEKVLEFTSSNNTNFLIFIAEDILPLLYEKRRYLKLLYNNSFDPYWITFLHHRYLPVIKKHFKNEIKEKCKKFDVNPSLIHDLIIGNILSLISSWIRSDSPEPPSIFREKFLALSSLSLKNLLDED